MPPLKNLSHLDHEGKARMVDVGDKPIQDRWASAQGFIHLQPGTLHMIQDHKMKKGAVLTVAELAGVQAAKQTSQLIPLCHNIILTRIKVVATPMDGGIRVMSEIRSQGQTGVEMEALTAVGVALLTVYDMCKSIDKTMVIDAIQLIEKEKHDLA